MNDSVAPYDAPILLNVGLAMNTLDDWKPQRRHPVTARTTVLQRSDPVSGWGENDLAGAACKGRYELFDLLLDVKRGARKRRPRYDRDYALDAAKRICRGCPARERCPDAEA